MKGVTPAVLMAGLLLGLGFRFWLPPLAGTQVETRKLVLVR